MIHQIDTLYQAEALQGTTFQAVTVAEFQSVFRREVTERLEDQGIKSVHDLVGQSAMIPMPETLTKLVGKAIGSQGYGLHVRLLSDYPFPHRRFEQSLDAFERDAITSLRGSLIDTFSRLEEFEGRPSMRLALAQRMDRQCVDCHNSHPESPKRDWQVGDVRGILEVIQPLDEKVAQGRSALLLTLSSTVAICVLGLLAGLMLVRHKSESTQRWQQAEAGMRSVLNNAADGIVTFDDQYRVGEFNETAESMFGISAGAASGESFLRIFDDPEGKLDGFVAQKRGASEDSSSGSRRVADIRVGKKSFSCEGTGRRADGTRFPAAISVGSIRWQGKIRFTCIVRDLSQQRDTEAALEQERAVIQELMQNLTESVYIYFKDKDSRFLRINAALADKLGLSSQQEVRGKTDFDVFPEDYAQRAFHDEQQIIRTGKPAISIEEHATWPDGSRAWVTSTKIPLRAADGRIIGTFGISRDVTEIVNAREELRRASEIAAQANRAKSEFLANMSHEIRTPMGGILGMTDLALQTDLTPDQREYLTTVKSSSEQLLHTINDILDFSKIEAGKMELEIAPFKLRGVLGATLRSLAYRADENGLELAVRIAPDIPEDLIGDSHRLRQVILNLVGNAIKFTQRGDVVLEVQMVEAADEIAAASAADQQVSVQSEHGHTRAGMHGGVSDSSGKNAASLGQIVLHFVVRDSGIGIQQEAIDRIFREFEQADGSTTRRFGGTGLGLTISRRLVELMQGKIWVDSRLGVGSNFHFTVRLGIASAQQPERAVDAGILEGLPVLVVDDNAVNLRILEEMLTNWRMRPALATSAAEAMRELTAAEQRGEPYRLVLLDRQMPDVDGFALAEQIRSRPALLKATLMMLTSANQTGDVARCQQIGIAGYLTKPVIDSELFDRILQLLDKGTLQLDKETQTASPLVRTDCPLHVLIVEDNLVNQRLVARFLDRRGHTSEIASDGIEALQTLQKGKFDVVLMDVQMPRMGGLEATAQIRLQEQGTQEHIPVVAATANAMKGDREACLAAGMDAYVSKPVRQDELIRVIEAQGVRRSKSQQILKPATVGSTGDESASGDETRAGLNTNWLQVQSVSRQPDSAEDPSRQASGDKPLLDWELALSHVMDDEELLSELITVFLESLPQWQQDLTAAIANRNQILATRLAHTLKSSLRQFAAAIRDRCQDLETACGQGNFDEATRILPEVLASVEKLKPLLQDRLGNSPA